MSLPGIVRLPQAVACDSVHRSVNGERGRGPYRENELWEGAEAARPETKLRKSSYGVTSSWRASDLSQPPWSDLSSLVSSRRPLVRRFALPRRRCHRNRLISAWSRLPPFVVVRMHGESTVLQDAACCLMGARHEMTDSTNPDRQQRSLPKEKRDTVDTQTPRAAKAPPVYACPARSWKQTRPRCARYECSAKDPQIRIRQSVVRRGSPSSTASRVPASYSTSSGCPLVAR